MVDHVDPPLVPVVARLYAQNGYRRASTKPGPGTPLVQLVDAQAAIDAWRQRAEQRQVSLEQASRERAQLIGATRDAVTALSKVGPARAYAEAVSVCAQLQRVLASLK